jgi:hypothetical protein
MFAASYFALTYFAPTYFAGGLGASTPATVEPASRPREPVGGRLAGGDYWVYVPIQGLYSLRVTPDGSEVQALLYTADPLAVHLVKGRYRVHFVNGRPRVSALS